MDERFDIGIIGAGTAGFAAAEAAAAAGLRLVIVSGAGDLGGTCILRGCMPAKTLLSSTEKLGDVDAAAGVGVTTERAHVDIPAIIDRKRELVDYFAEDRRHDWSVFRSCAAARDRRPGYHRGGWKADPGRALRARDRLADRPAADPRTDRVGLSNQ